MQQIAVFVDAGYLLAQGALLLANEKVPRQRMALNPQAAADALATLAAAAAPQSRLLRIYWYDGLVRGGNQTAEHVALGRTANVKLRLGLVNSRGEQKGVDSLIVTDMIELARNRGISDALILSGDEDIRVGLQVAQTFGVRVQLVGVKPALGSQSPDLVAEADTHAELDEAQIAAMLTIKEAKPKVEASAVDDGSPTDSDPIGNMAHELIGGLSDGERTMLGEYINANRGALPSEFDRPALAQLRDRLGRDVDDAERKAFRTAMRAALRTR